MDLRELYQTTILDHNKKPRNFRVLEEATAEGHGHNPLCGDELTVYVELDGDTIEDVAFQGSGCAISKASASLMTEQVKGHSVAELDAMFQAFHELVTSDPRSEPDVSEMGKLAVFAGVREYPMRVKCATLAWHTVRAAVHGDHQTAKTE